MVADTAKDPISTMNEKRYTVTINDKEYTFDNDYTIIQACEFSEIEIPRFCYHERLKIAGNCRMCLVEVVGAPKLVASCSANITDKMVIKTNSEKVKVGRENVMETLLINHPLDCPICDQGGECDLQDQAMLYGKNSSNFKEEKRVVPEKDFGRFIKTNMTRCIHCMRCVRFMDDIAGSHELDVLNRGENSEIFNLNDGDLKSKLSGNIIDLCPVGALTNATYAFKARPWELKRTASIDVMDSLCSNIYIDSYGLEILRILPRENDAVNEEWISNETRFSFDGLRYNRLMSPLLRVVENDSVKFKKISWDEALDVLYKRISLAAPNKIFVSSGDLADFESLRALKKLCEYLRITQFDCRSSVPYLPNNFNSLFNTGVLNIDEADCVLIIGCNIENEVPVLNARIRKNINSKKLPVYVIGGEYELNYDYKFLGNNIDILTKILNDDIDFAETLNGASKPMIILGENLFSISEGFSNYLCNALGKILKKFNNVITDSWNGLNVLFKNPGLINGILSEFMPKNSKFSNFDDSDLDLCFLLCDDSIDLMKVDAGFVVYQGHHGCENAFLSDLILPSLAYTEKSATYFNLEGAAQKTNKVINLPDCIAMKDVEIIEKIAKKFNLNLNALSDIDYKYELNLDGLSNLDSNREFDFDNFSHEISSLSFDKKNIIVKNSRYFNDL
jgi:NADH-quinone oxidoreductase subunit G